MENLRQLFTSRNALLLWSRRHRGQPRWGPGSCHRYGRLGQWGRPLAHHISALEGQARILHCTRHKERLDSNLVQQALLEASCVPNYFSTITETAPRGPHVTKDPSARMAAHALRVLLYIPWADVFTAELSPPDAGLPRRNNYRNNPPICKDGSECTKRTLNLLDLSSKTPKLIIWTAELSLQTEANQCPSTWWHGTNMHRLDTTSQTSLVWSVQAAWCIDTWSTPKVIIVLGANWYNISYRYSKVWKLCICFFAHHGKQSGTVQGHKRLFHMM